MSRRILAGVVDTVEVAAVDPIASMVAVDNMQLVDIAKEIRAKLERAIAAL